MDLFNWLPCVPLGFFRIREYCFCSYFLLKSSNCFPDQTPIFGRSFIFCTFVWNDASLNFRLQVVTLPASLTLSWPAKTAKKSNMSGVDFLPLVLQSSNSFDLKAFFKIWLVYILLITRSLFNWRIQLTPSCSSGNFWKASKMFLFFCSFEIFKLFSR